MLLAPGKLIRIKVFLPHDLEAVQRVGPDGLFKPCLLRGEAFVPVDPARAYEPQLLDTIGAMLGEEERFEYAAGAPA